MKKKGLFLSLLVISIFVFAAVAGAANIYIDPNGDDGKNGETAANAVKTLNKALALVGDGEIIYFAAGTYTATNNLSEDRGASYTPCSFDRA